ncbi:MAG TPA: hypothetical protein PLY34_19410, partial [Ferruginibacter sp.]|nr:hypothetical protein [Ferruginibacter sp.]
SWTVPNGISSTQCLIRANSIAFPTIADTSDAVFSIVNNPAITVTSPNGGENFISGTSRTITWTNTAQASGLYNIQFSPNGGTNYSTIASGVSGNSYVWNQVINVPSTDCFIRVQDAGNTCKNDVSDAAFTILPRTPLLTYPNGGETFVSVSTIAITWSIETFYNGTVRLEYSLDNGASWILITASTTNDGTQSWTLPFTNSTQCLVKVSDATNVSLNDISNTTFTITPIIEVTNPNGLDELGACTQTSITFTHPSTYTSFDLAYSTNDGLNWTTIATAYTQTGTTGSYNWSIPNVSSTQARVRVSPTGNPQYGDISNASFTIKPSVTLIQPNFGGTLVAGAIFPIKWSSDGISNIYDIAYSTTSSAGPWTNIVVGYNTATNTYNWTVPNILSSNCYIRITDNVNSCKQDISNFPFTIAASAQPITITNSNGLDTLLGCQNYTIRWTESGAAIGSYNIDLSTNGGVSWSSIASSYSTTSGSYNWIVPNVITDLALVRVSSAINSTVFDASDAAFSIKGRSITASRDTSICTAGNLQLTATGGLGAFAWTPALGLNNANIANPVATVNSSIQYVVSSSNGTCVISDTVSITLAKPIKVTVEVNTPVVCAGAAARFTAHASDATAASYQWKKNNVDIGTSDSVLLVSGPLTSDVFTCTVSSALPCISSATSTGVSVTAYQALGNDTTLLVSCVNCTTNIASLYNTSQYTSVTWSTATPASVRVGAYTVIVTGGSCIDTAVVNVNVSEANDVRGCAVGNFFVQSDITGTSYQWQVNNGGGFVNISNNATYTGANSAQLQVKNAPSSYYGYQYRCLVDGVNNSAVKTLKISTVWTGAVSNDWNVAGNWSCGRVPDVNTDVYVYNGITNYPVVTTAISCRSITAATGTTVTVSTGGSILLTGK